MPAVHIHLNVNLAFNGLARMGFLQLPVTFSTIRTGQEVGALNIKH